MQCPILTGLNCSCDAIVFIRGETLSELSVQWLGARDKIQTFPCFSELLKALKQIDYPIPWETKTRAFSVS